MRSTRVLCIVVLAVCGATGSWAQEVASSLPPGKIVRTGKDTYTIRETEPRDDPYGHAKQKASEYCKKMRKVMTIKDGSFGLAEGEILTFTCVAPNKGAAHP